MRHGMYNDNLREAIRFEDFVGHELSLRGIAFRSFRSVEYQTLVGENSAGLEIKLDRRRRETGNVFVETAERHNCNAEWKPSGPFKGDNTILVAIGDFKEFRIFGAKTLRRLYDRFAIGARVYRLVETETAKGFLLPAKVADDFCEAIFPNETPLHTPPTFERQSVVLSDNPVSAVTGATGL